MSDKPTNVTFWLDVTAFVALSVLAGFSLLAVIQGNKQALPLLCSSFAGSVAYSRLALGAKP